MEKIINFLKSCFKKQVNSHTGQLKINGKAYIQYNKEIYLHINHENINHENINSTSGEIIINGKLNTPCGKEVLIKI